MSYDVIDKVNSLFEITKGYKEKRTKKALAEVISMSDANLNKLLKRDGNRRFQADHLPLIAWYFSVPITFFSKDDDTLIPKNRVIPFVGLASCGIPKEYYLDGYEQREIPSDYYKDGMYAVQADGKSMEPRIKHNETIYCDPSQTVNNGDIVHYWIDGESGIKKLKISEKDNREAWLIPENDDFDVITIDNIEREDLKMVKVVGRLEWGI